MTGFSGEVINNATIMRGRRIIKTLSTREDHVVDFTDDDNFYKALNSNVNVAKVGESKGRHLVTLESLSQKWLILPEADIRTVQHTTQQGIRTNLHSSLLQIFNTNDQSLRYNKMQHIVFIYTIQVGTVLSRG